MKRAWLLFFLTSPAHADPGELLARAKRAAGGAALDRITTWHQISAVETSGLRGRSESWCDVRTGRSRQEFTLGPASGASGFDGITSWEEDSSQQVKTSQSPGDRESAANDAYRCALAYFFPERWPATLEALGPKSEGARKLEVIRITPHGGRPFELWLDAQTWLIDRTVEHESLETRTMFSSDYRVVDGVRVDFAQRATNGDSKYDQLMRVEKVNFNAPVDPARFRVPPPPPPDFSVINGVSTTVPFQLVNNHIYVEVKINGQGPFSVLCDTGGVNIVTPELAKQLGLRTEGALEGRGVGEKSEDVGLTRVEKLQIGDATIQAQLFSVFPLGPFSQVEGVQQYGLVGYEVFKRFVVTVDYAGRRLTLTVPGKYRAPADGTVVPFDFHGSTPQVDGEIDGLRGKFDIDTGSRASLDLLAPFIEEHHLIAKYQPKLSAVTGWGVGGPARASVTRAQKLKLGTVEVSAPVTELSLQKKGAFTDRYVAGNVGAGVLKKFTLTFDYGKKTIRFQPNRDHDEKDRFDQSGMWINVGDGALVVVDVTAGGPAQAAGLQVGDRIVELDGKPARELSLPEVRAGFRTRPSGTKIALTVERAGKKFMMTLQLRELV